MPPWAVGKTADEILNLATQAVGALQNYSPPAPQPAAAPSFGGIPQMPDPDLAYSNPREWAAQYEAYNSWRMGAAMQSYAAPVMGQLSELARQQSKNGQHAEIWRRWEPEIELKLAGIPREQRSLALYDQAAALVKADHVEELATERAQKLAGAGAVAATERGGWGGSPTLTEDPLEKAFASDHPFFQRARENGLTPQSVRAFLAERGMSAEDYIANATRGSVLATKDGFRRTHDG